MVRTKRPVLLNGFFNLRAKRSIQSASIQMDQALGILIEPVRLKVGTGSILFGDLRVHDGRLGKTSGSRRACFGTFSRYKGSVIAFFAMTRGVVPHAKYLGMVT